MNRQRSNILYAIFDPQAPPAEPDTSALEKSNDPPQNISFYLTGHLGNTRVNFRAGAGGTIEVLYAADYFSFGKVLREYKPCEANRFLSTQHERDQVTGYDNRRPRLYDSELGRFLGVDALAGEFAPWSSYNYVFGNPVKLTDPTGMAPEGGGVEIIENADGNAQLEVSATVYIYGDTHSGLARDLNHQVNLQWNSTATGTPSASRQPGSAEIPVHFNINFIEVSSDEAASLAENNVDPTVNFMRITNADPIDYGSHFEGNTGILNLHQNRTRGGTTAAHEIGHMLGFDSGFTDDHTHFSDQALQNIPVQGGDQKLSGTALPIMYAGGQFINNLGGRVRTTADIQGLGLDRVLNNTTNYIGEPMINQLR